MRRLSEQAGLLLVDVIVALALFGFVLLALYQLYGPTFLLYRNIDEQLSAQQDARLAIDRVARLLHETTSAYGRLRVYQAESGCSGAYEGCVGFVTARDENCAGTFRLVDGAPDWQATLYVWRDPRSNELRTRCDPSATFPVEIWPPPTLEPHTVIGIRVAAASITLEPADTRRPTAIAITLQEQAPSSQHRSRTTVFNATVLLPKNR